VIDPASWPADAVASMLITMMESREQPGFRPYSALHAAAVLWSALLAGTAILIGRSMRRIPGQEVILRHGLAGAVLVFYAWYMAFELRPTGFDIERSLPLHLCDLAWIPCSLALLTLRRRAMAVAYFWGIALSSQAFITPTLTYPPTSLYFWTFMFGHTLIVGVPIYLVIVHGYRPDWRGLVFALAVTLGLVAIQFSINLILDTNYGYVGESEPAQRTAIDALGPWPLRVLWMILLGSAAFVLVYLPWPIAAAVQRRLRQ
jgi:hypothetical integral membrane protein (TIGR02206 family)